MSELLQIKARRLRIDLWVYVPVDEDMPPARIVADGITEGLGDAWFDLDDGDPHSVSAIWHAEYAGDEEIVAVLDA